jgi:hypothetical protein
LSAKLVPTFADRGYQVVSVIDPYGRSLGFLDRKLKYNMYNTSYNTIYKAIICYAKVINLVLSFRFAFFWDQ